MKKAARYDLAFANLSLIFNTEVAAPLPKTQAKTPNQNLVYLITFLFGRISENGAVEKCSQLSSNTIFLRNPRCHPWSYFDQVLYCSVFGKSGVVENWYSQISNYNIF